jgi:peptide methionine sulfoxide reductase msrA/msrB
MMKLFTAIGFGTLISAFGVMVMRAQIKADGSDESTSTTAPMISAAPKVEKAIFSGGCFWGMEYYFQHAKGVLSTEVGYTGGHTKNPTYREVCSHTTGHIEALQVTYDANVTSYEELERLFFEIHDPTQADGQGPDIGEQYHSVVFYADEAQKKTTEKLIGLLKSRGYNVVTQLRPATTFWKAEEYHQKYYEKENGTPYCHRPVKRFG